MAKQTRELLSQPISQSTDPDIICIFAKNQNICPLLLFIFNNNISIYNMVLGQQPKVWIAQPTRAWLDDWLADWLAGWLIGWLADGLVGWLVDWLTGWLADWLAGWLVDWLTARPQASLLLSRIWDFPNQSNLVAGSWWVYTLGVSGVGCTLGGCTANSVLSVSGALFAGTSVLPPQQWLSWPDIHPPRPKGRTERNTDNIHVLKKLLWFWITQITLAAQSSAMQNSSGGISPIVPPHGTRGTSSQL